MPEPLAVVRAPEDRFVDLPDFPYEPRWVELDGLRMAYVDVGTGERGTWLLLHGEPSWSFLYRRMIPPLVAAGFRCIAPDLIGFGRSDQPVDPAAYTYAAHVGWMCSFRDHLRRDLGIDRVSLFAQDWGGLIGLRVVADDPTFFERIAIGNTALPTGESAGPGFDAWLAYSQSEAFDDVGALFGRAVQARQLTEAEMDGYRAPFPSREHMTGAIVFPTLVPVTPEHDGVAENRRAWEVLERFDRPFLTVWCPEDMVLGHLAPTFIERIPGAAGQPHAELRPGGHFLQDDRGEDVAAILVDWCAGR